MSRSERLLDLLQVLRRHRRPVSGQALAQELGVSLRTLYRDIATLQGQGADIRGEPGIGYVLKPGFLLPPLMFSPDEIDALVLGSRWVADRADSPLAGAARDALAKIAAVLPAELSDTLQGTALLVGPGAGIPSDVVDVALVRRAIRTETKLVITYRGGSGEAGPRTVWPIALSFFDKVRILVAWCERRADFRHFRTDRIATIADGGGRFPRRRAVLLKEWRAAQGIARDLD